jgi:uncharacterized protein involved in outer membrane biogenesis
MSSKVKALTLAIAGILALLIAAPWLVPLRTFIPSIEARASERLGQPVKLGGLRVSILPLQLTATQVTSPLAQVGRITVRPSLFHLFSDTRVLDEVKLDHVRVRPEFFRRVAVQPASAGPPGVRVRRIVLSNVELRFGRSTLTALDGVITLAADGSVKQIRVHHQGDRLRITAMPTARGYEVNIAGRQWTVPVGPPILFDRIAATARLTAKGISTLALSASLYGGTLEGPLEVRWRPVWSIAGELALDGVEVQSLAPLLWSDAAVSGRLQAKPRFVTRARDAYALVTNLELRSDFQVEGGVLREVDLEAAARNPLSRHAGRRGSTRFERLTGHLEIDREGYHFSGLEVTSGLLAAAGEVSVSRDQRLNGRVDAQLKGTGSLFAVPLQVGGTLHEPSVMPTTTAVAGAVVGSVLLPGIGTAVGLKAGQLTDKLFGRKRRPDATRPAREPEAAATPRPRR